MNVKAEQRSFGSLSASAPSGRWEGSGEIRGHQHHEVFMGPDESRQQGCWGRLLWYRPGLCQCRFRMAIWSLNRQIVSGQSQINCRPKQFYCRPRPAAQLLIPFALYTSHALAPPTPMLAGGQP
jgi:hypothetical protein